MCDVQIWLWERNTYSMKKRKKMGKKKKYLLLWRQQKKVLVLLSVSIKRICVSRTRDFYEDFQIADLTALHKWGGAHQTSNHLPKPNL